MITVYHLPAKKENTESLRVTAYCRVSTKKKSQMDSLAYQVMVYGGYYFKYRSVNTIDV